jgi:hypothetical protein
MDKKRNKKAVGQTIHARFVAAGGVELEIRPRNDKPRVVEFTGRPVERKRKRRSALRPNA